MSTAQETLGYEVKNSYVCIQQIKLSFNLFQSSGQTLWCCYHQNTRGGLSVYNPETGYCNNCDNGHVSVIVWESDTVFCTPQIFL